VASACSQALCVALRLSRAPETPSQMAMMLPHMSRRLLLMSLQQGGGVVWSSIINSKLHHTPHDAWSRNGEVVSRLSPPGHDVHTDRSRTLHFNKLYAGDHLETALCLHPQCQALVLFTMLQWQGPLLTPSCRR
jgi:hypothetical protein